MLLVNADSSEIMSLITNFLNKNHISSKVIEDEDLLDYFLGKEMELVDITDLADKNEFVSYLEANK